MMQGPNMEAMPIPNSPALIIDNRILVVADLHIGMERELKEAGFILPSQTENITKRLISILQDKKPEKLIVLGDLKHNIPKTSRQEWDEIPLLVETLQEYVEEVEVLLYKVVVLHLEMLEQVVMVQQLLFQVHQRLILVEVEVVHMDLKELQN